MATRAFGQRKALAPLHNIQNENIIVQTKQKPLRLASIKNVQNENEYPIKNFEKTKKDDSCSFAIYNEDNSENICPASGNEQEILLQENIVAVEKELNNILVDSFEKSLANSENDLTDCLMADLEKDESENADLSLSSSSLEDNFYCQQYESDPITKYNNSIMMYMLERERQFMPNPFYMNNQENINSKMRSILVDWLVDVKDEYNLKDETFFLTINYIDRFLSKYSILRQDFQLLGTSALFIASKYEEVYPPDIAEFVYITDDSFTKNQVFAMERNILNGLSFDISVPTSNYFLDLFVCQLGVDRKTYFLSKYLLYLSTLESSPFLKYYPSEIALCSIVLAVKLFKNHDQITDKFIAESFCYEKKLGNKGNVNQLANDRNKLLEHLNALLTFAPKHPQQAIKKMFSDKKYCNVAEIDYDSDI